MIPSEWGTPNMMENGLNPELLFGRQIRPGAAGGELHKRRHQQVLDLGTEQQMVLELRPAHDPNETYGSGCVVTSLKDLSSSIWVWHREGSNGASARRVCKAIEIPAEPGDPEKLPPQLRRFKAVSPLVTDINLSLDDRFLYVSRWGTGEFLQL